MSDVLLTLDALGARTRAIADDPRVAIRPLGASRLGRPIELVSVGQGDRDALIVGVPHPNEPAGAVTVDRMIAGLLSGTMPSVGYRWHFITAIDPDGLALNEGWLTGPCSVDRYLSHFFRPALDRQPETTFPLDVPGIRFDRPTPENLAWQEAFALTRPALHASLHHCDYGGGFFSLSRALPAALAPLERVLARSGFGVHGLDGDVMTVDQWSPAVSRYPSVPELVANAAAAGESWASPWTVGEMSPGFGESRYGTLTLIAEAPLWESAALHDGSPSGVTRAAQAAMLAEIVDRARRIASRHLPGLARQPVSADAEECLHALQAGFAMMPSAAPPPPGDAAGDAMLSRRAFQMIHTRQVLFVLRTYGLLASSANAILAIDPECGIALAARRDAVAEIRAETDALATFARLEPVPLDRFVAFQTQATLACAEALRD